MISDWEDIGLKVGSLTPDKSVESGSSQLGQRALEELLRDQWVKGTVDFIIEAKRGGELAMNCLRLIKSEKAVRCAYNLYKNSTNERVVEAVWLIKHLAHPTSFEWVEEFIRDDNVITWGIGLLDQLLWTEEIDYNTHKVKVDYLLGLAISKSKIHKDSVDFI